MSSNITNTVPYLRTSRSFPHEAQPLSIELSKSYVEIASFVNARTIGIFPQNNPAVTGEQWFINGLSGKQQTLRQVYTFTAEGSTPHGIDTTQIAGFVQIYGAFTDGTNFYPLPYVDVANANNQVNIYVSPTDIVITAGSGSPPSITSGYVVLTWLSNV